MDLTSPLKGRKKGGLVDLSLSKRISTPQCCAVEATLSITLFEQSAYRL